MLEFFLPLNLEDLDWDCVGVFLSYRPAFQNAFRNSGLIGATLDLGARGVPDHQRPTGFQSPALSQRRSSA